MKYLAILKDSFREAVDTTVLPIMLVLSLLLILFVSSVSFRPISVEDDAGQFVNALHFVYVLQRDRFPETPQVELADYAENDPALPAWQRDYSFTLRIRPLPAPGLFPVMPGPRQEALFLAQMFLREHFKYLDKLEIKEEKGDTPDETKLVVRSTGTKVNNYRGWKHEPVILFGLQPVPIWRDYLGDMVYKFQDYLVLTFGGSIAVLVGLFITAFFIPNMVRKGTVDLLLVKPIHRVTLLVFKYLGGLTFMFLTTGFLVVGLWVVLGVRTGIWGFGFLASILVMTYFFAILYAFSTLVGVVTRSPVVSILMSVLIWGLLIGFNYLVYPVIDGTRTPPEPPRMGRNFRPNRPPKVDEENPRPPEDFQPPFPVWVYTTADIIHFCVPPTRELMLVNSRMMREDALLKDNPKLADEKAPKMDWAAALGISAAYIVLIVGLSCAWFGWKDY